MGGADWCNINLFFFTIFKILGRYSEIGEIIQSADNNDDGRFLLIIVVKRHII